ncbi:MAG: hypothetical protein JW959_10795 [Pirellulales bacterium]|nr:hypothetical protein [Pirellulales bacterium]
MTNEKLIELARERLWVSEVGYYPDGRVVFNADSLATALDASKRLLCRGRPPTWVSFALCSSLEMAQATCDAMEEYLCRYAESHGQKKPVTLLDQIAELVRESYSTDSEEGEEDEEVTASAIGVDEEPWEH